MSFFDDILGMVDADDRELFDRNPKIKDAITKLEAQYTEADDLLKKWENWKQAAWDHESGMPKTEAQARRELAASMQRVSELEANQGVDMGFDEILDGLKKQGFVTASDLDNKIKSGEIVNNKTHESAMNNMAYGIEYFYGNTAHLPVQHRDEFGENFKIKDLLKYMNEQKITDPEAAYNKMVEPKRTELSKAAEAKRDEEIKAQIEAARADERQKVLGETAMSRGSMPVDQEAQTGHLQAQMRQRAEDKQPDVPVNAKLGDGLLSQIGFSELQKNRAGTVQ